MGIFVAGTTGRFSHFSPEQNADICRCVRDAVGDQAVIYTGISDSGLHRILSNAERMTTAGAAVLVTTGPYYLSRSVDEAEADLARIADLAPLPLLFYNIPEFVGYGLRPEWLGEISDHPNVVGYKDSSNDLPHHLNVIARIRHKQFSVLIGKELLLAEAMRAGARGLVVSLVHVNPQPFVFLAQHARLGDWDAAEKDQEKIRLIWGQFLSAFEKRPVFSTLMLFLEGELSRQGLPLRLI